jgi:hypothetical protein
LRQSGGWLGRGPSGDGRAQLLAGIPAVLVAAGVACPPRWLAARTPGTKPLLRACVAICTSCGDECERHARHYEHCRVCEQACRRCEQACRELLDALK